MFNKWFQKLRSVFGKKATTGANVNAEDDGLIVRYNPSHGATYFNVRRNGKTDMEALNNFSSMMDESLVLRQYLCRRNEDNPPFMIKPADGEPDGMDPRVKPDGWDLYLQMCRLGLKFAGNKRIQFSSYPAVRFRMDFSGGPSIFLPEEPWGMR